MITLRPYQQDCLASIIESAKQGQRKQGVVMPTGTGKSLVQAELVRQALKGGKRVAMLMPFDHLIDNALENLALLVDMELVGVVKAERNEIDKPCIVISTGTALVPERMAQLRGQFDLVIVDEMHYYAADSWSTVVEGLGSAQELRVGFSATIMRMDRQGLAALFGVISYHYSIAAAIADGWLVPITGVRLDAELDLDGVTRVGAGYDEKQLESLLNVPDRMELIYRGWYTHAHDRITIAFTPTIAAAQDYAAYWQAQGIAADWICGAGPQLSQAAMERKIDAYKSGKIQILFNAAKLIVGFDYRPISCVLLLSPTHSQTRLIQQTGRATRICSDELYQSLVSELGPQMLQQKRDALIIDVCHSTDMGLCQFPDIFDLPQKEREALIEQLERGEAVTTAEILEQHGPLLRAKSVIAQRIDLFGESGYHWTKTDFGWAIATKQHRLLVERVGRSGLYTVRSVAGKQTSWVQQSPTSLDWAMALAEAQCRGEGDDAKRLFEKGAEWREGPLTYRQYETLLSLRHTFSPKSYKALVARGNMTAGQASDLIGKKLAERDTRRLKREEKKARDAAALAKANAEAREAARAAKRKARP